MDEYDPNAPQGNAADREKWLEDKLEAARENASQHLADVERLRGELETALKRASEAEALYAKAIHTDQPAFQALREQRDAAEAERDAALSREVALRNALSSVRTDWNISGPHRAVSAMSLALGDAALSQPDASRDYLARVRREALEEAAKVAADWMRNGFLAERIRALTQGSIPAPSVTADAPGDCDACIVSWARHGRACEAHKDRKGPDWKAIRATLDAPGEAWPRCMLCGETRLKHGGMTHGYCVPAVLDVKENP